MLESSAPEHEPSVRRPLPRLAALALVLVAGIVAGVVLTGRDSPTYFGWDECMHTALPATRVLVELDEGDTRAAAHTVLACNQYPPVYPLVLAAAQGAFGVGERSSRNTTLWLWIFASCAGGFLLARELARGLPRSWASGGGFLLWLPLLSLATPVACNFAGTLFLEVPFLALSFFALRAWLRRKPAQPDGEARPARSRQLLAGAWVMALFFTKFNYGALLGAALAVDWALDGGCAWRRGRLGAWLAGTAWLLVVPVLSLAWWFLLPLPEGWSTAVEHQERFWGFLTGTNLEHSFPLKGRLLATVVGVTWSPAGLACVLVGLLSSLRLLRCEGVRLLWIVLLVTLLPVWSHPFFLERFLIPSTLPLWGLVGIGWHGLFARWARLPHPLLNTAAGCALVAVVVLLVPYDATRLGQRLGLVANEAAFTEQLARRGWGGTVPSAGLPHAEVEGFIELMAAELEPGEAFGWVRLTDRLPPATLHLLLLERTGDRTRFLRDAGEYLDVVPVAGWAAPEWSLAELAEWADQWDVIFMTDPVSFPEPERRPGWRERIQDPLARELAWTPRRLGVVPVARSSTETVEVSLYALRKR